MMKPQLRHALVRRLLNNQGAKTSINQKGFTLIEIVVVVIIIAILSSIALPAFLGQATRAKISSAKTLAAAVSRECQVALVEGTNGSFSPTTAGADDIDTSWPATTTCPGSFSATVNSLNVAFTATVASSDGSVSKVCTSGDQGCDASGTW